MPAKTVDDLLTLPRIVVTGPGEQRPVRSITTAPKSFEGEGFPVRRAFSGVDLSILDPFIHMDQMGEIEYGPGEPKGTPWHPHRGFETVTYMLDGTLCHRDTHGGGGTISDGDTQWMTAGSGLLHIEAPPEHVVTSGGLFHGFQLWVNLPRRLKMTDPRYQDIGGGDIELLTSHDGGALIRLIAGEVDGHGGPGVTHTPITLLHVSLEPGAQLDIPWRSDFNALVYALSGAGSVGPGRDVLNNFQLATFGGGDVIRVAAHDRTALDVIVLGGLPISEPIAAYGPFVMNTRDELVTAFEDFQAGRLGTVPADSHAGHDVL